MSRIIGNLAIRNSNPPPQILSVLLNGPAGSTGPTGATGPTGSAGSAGPTGNIYYVQIYKAQYNTGTEGGTMTANTWNVRPLNSTGGGNMDGLYTSLAGNTITFAAGTYVITGRAVSWLVGMNQLRLRDTTNNVTLANGLVVQASTGFNGAASQNLAEVSTISTFASSTNVQLQHNCLHTVATNGMGSSGAFSAREIEIYASVDILKVN